MQKHESESSLVQTTAISLSSVPRVATPLSSFSSCESSTTSDDHYFSDTSADPPPAESASYPQLSLPIAVRNLSESNLSDETCEYPSRTAVSPPSSSFLITNKDNNSNNSESEFKVKESISKSNSDSLISSSSSASTVVNQFNETMVGGHSSTDNSGLQSHTRHHLHHPSHHHQRHHHHPQHHHRSLHHHHHHHHRHHSQSSSSTATSTSNLLRTQPPKSEANHFSSTKRCVLRLDGYSYLIVANPPESKTGSKAEADSGSITANNNETTIHEIESKDPSYSTTIALGQQLQQQQSSSDEELQLDTFPPVDTLEACDKAAARLRKIAHHLTHGEVPPDVLQKTLQYAAYVLDTVSMDETRQSSSVIGVRRKPGPPLRAPSEPLPLASVSRQGSLPSSRHQLLDKQHQLQHQQAFSPKVSKTDQIASDLRRTNLKAAKPWSRRLLDEEDDLSEVQPDAVPNEVREWLATTFTRNNTAQKRRSEDKPKFRSVANAIRAGIMVDRLYRRLCSSNLVQIPTNIADKLKAVDDWTFDIFGLNEAASGQVLKYISYELLNRYGLIQKFKVPQSSFDHFIHHIEQGYLKYKNPYHNNLHAADVTQAVHFILSQLGLMNWLTDLEIFATIIAAIIHDYQHTGTTNNFHVMSGSETAILYNDRAVLENFHVSAAFKVILEDESNILINLSKEEYREFRGLVIDMVLATDMSSHFQQIKTMKSLIGHSGQELSVDKSKALSLVLHCCDISHPSKEWNIHRRWTELLMEEFFRQGDKEKELGLPYSPLCDRNTTLVADSQIGFIDFIVGPSMEVCGDLLDKIHQSIQAASGSYSHSSPVPVEHSLDESKSRPKSLCTIKNNKGILSLDSGSELMKTRPVTSAPASPRFSRFSTPASGLGSHLRDGRIIRPWVKPLEENRGRWQERAVMDRKNQDEKKLKSEAADRQLSPSPESEL